MMCKNGNALCADQSDQSHECPRPYTERELEAVMDDLCISWARDRGDWDILSHPLAQARPDVRERLDRFQKIMLADWAKADREREEAKLRAERDRIGRLGVELGLIHSPEPTLEDRYRILLIDRLTRIGEALEALERHTDQVALAR